MVRTAMRMTTPAGTRRVQMVMTAMLIALLAAISLSASAQPAPPPPAAMADRGPGGERGWGGMHRGHGMGEGGMGGPGMMFRGSPEHMNRMIDRMLDGLGASDAQRAQIKQIAASAAADLKAQGQAGKATRQRAMQAFTAPTVDAAAVEQSRQQMLQQHDQMSRRMTQAMLDVARVLTPEQRARLGERMRDRQARMEERMQRMQRMPGQPGEPPRR